MVTLVPATTHRAHGQEHDPGAPRHLGRHVLHVVRPVRDRPALAARSGCRSAFASVEDRTQGAAARTAIGETLTTASAAARADRRHRGPRHRSPDLANGSKLAEEISLTLVDTGEAYREGGRASRRRSRPSPRRSAPRSRRPPTSSPPPSTPTPTTPSDSGSSTRATRSPRRSRPIHVHGVQSGDQHHPSLQQRYLRRREPARRPPGPALSLAAVERRIFGLETSTASPAPLPGDAG